MWYSYVHAWVICIIPYDILMEGYAPVFLLSISRKGLRSYPICVPQHLLVVLHSCMFSGAFLSCFFILASPRCFLTPLFVYLKLWFRVLSPLSKLRFDSPPTSPLPSGAINFMPQLPMERYSPFSSRKYVDIQGRNGHRTWTLITKAESLHRQQILRSSANFEGGLKCLLHHLRLKTDFSRSLVKES